MRHGAGADINAAVRQAAEAIIKEDGGMTALAVTDKAAKQNTAWEIVI